ncbi:response regulator transcription factor [Desulfonatronum thiodismutans]|uniref:response regulator n=1 Tax=Desulfonatronum thiodismutans TaxID=159290 RepID=UPI0004ABDA46|nr:response regulator [Desulfonatronum thiodismutans]
MESRIVAENKVEHVGSVLLIEPDAGMARAMESELARGNFAVRVVRSHLGALGMIEDLREPHVVLVPAEATDIDGFDFVHLVRHRNRFLGQCLPIIMVGSGDNFARIARSDDGGIADFLLRPYFPGELVWRVRKAWKVLERRRQSDSLEYMDTSSGILTTAGLKRAIHEELNKSFRKRACFSLAVVAFHRLEDVHLNYGLMMAEWMERDLSVQVRLALRSYDRLGKIEFGMYCLLAPDVDREHLQMLIYRLGGQIRDWNGSVARNSHIRTPLELKVRPLTVLPQFEPRHLTKAAALLWDWADQREGHVDITRAEFSETVLTPKVVMERLLPDLPPGGGTPLGHPQRS